MRTRKFLEVDGPLHFWQGSQKYDMKTQLKHRLLTKLGWQVYHLAWDDWPISNAYREPQVYHLLSNPPPGESLPFYEKVSTPAYDSSVPMDHVASNFADSGHGDDGGCFYESGAEESEDEK